MPITVNSPYSGRPVKVRDQDLERAVRDEEGRVFYVVPRASGEGHYAALTRKGSAKDEQRYDAMATKSAAAHEQSRVQQAAVHDATGRRRARPWLRVLGLILLLLIAAAIAYHLLVGFTGTPALPGGDEVIPTDPLNFPNPNPPVPQLSLDPPWSLAGVNLQFA